MNLEISRINIFQNSGIIALLLYFFTLNSSLAQTPSDALTMNKNGICIAALYQHDTWNQYWEANLLRENQNIGTLTRKTKTSMLAYGISDKLNVFAILPFVTTSASGGQMLGVSDWQDLSIFTKYKIFDKRAFQIFASAGYSFPVTHYLSDYMPLNLGLSTDELTLRCIAKYELESNVYFRASGAFIHRTTTEAERDYYYFDQVSIYTTKMNVPDAINIDAAVGAWLFDEMIQIEANTVHQNSLSGDDIRRQNSPQPTNKMNFNNMAGYVRYFPRFLKGFSLIGQYSKTLAGRNVGKSQVMTFGISYQFLTKSKETNP